MLVPNIWSTFWSPSFWLPANVTWDDVKSNDVIQYPDFSHICFPILLSLGVTALRFLIERCVLKFKFFDLSFIHFLALIDSRHFFLPLGLRWGVNNTKHKLAANESLETAFRNQKARNFSDKQIHALSKQTDLSEQQVVRWISRRTTQTLPSSLAKFTESGWRLTYHTFMTVLGFYVLWDKPWFANMNECWRNYPHQVIGQVFYQLSSSSFLLDFNLLCLLEFTMGRRSVLYDRNELLLVHIVLAISGCPAQRFFTNVNSPRCYHCAHGRIVHDQLCQSWFFNFAHA